MVDASLSSNAYPEPNEKAISIAIFGLSANPPTGNEGHVGIVKHLVASNFFDEIWILPVYQHIFQVKRSLEAYEHRLAMCQLCFTPQSTKKCVVKVLPLEREAYELASSARTASSDQNSSEAPPLRIGTIDIIEMIKSRPFKSSEVSYKDVVEGKVATDLVDLHLVLGSDTFRDLMVGKWKGTESLLSSVTLEVFQRIGGVSVSEMLDTFHGHLLRSKADVNEHIVSALGSVSSTAIRAWNPPFLAELYGNLSISVSNLFQRKKIHRKEPLISAEEIHPDVLKYIEDNNLYFYSPEARKRRFFNRFFSATLVAVGAVTAFLYCRKRK